MSASRTAVFFVSGWLRPGTLLALVALELTHRPQVHSRERTRSSGLRAASQTLL